MRAGQAREFDLSYTTDTVSVVEQRTGGSVDQDVLVGCTRQRTGSCGEVIRAQHAIS